MHRRQFLLGGAGALAAGAAGVYTLTADGSASDTGSTGDPGPAAEPNTASVTRGDLASERAFRATISFGEPWPLGIDRTGTVTAAVAAGTIIEHGDELVRIDEKPVFLAAGTMPMYRTLERIDTRQRDENNKRLTLLEGADVVQLQTFLVGRGHDDDGKLEIDGIFGNSTEKAVRAWQKATSLPQTGRLGSGQVVFSPDPVRISSGIRNGAAFQAIEVTRAKALILVDTNNRDRGAIAPGTAVTIVLPDGERVPGEATKQEQATGADNNAVWRTTIDSSAVLPSEVGTATIEVIDVSVSDAVLVPASALLALAEGGFAVEKATGDRTQLIRVDVVDVLDGRAAVTGGIEPGDEVVVPT